MTKYQFPVKKGIVDLRDGSFIANDHDNNHNNNSEKENYTVEWKGLDYNTDFIDEYVTQLVGENQIEDLHRVLGSVMLNTDDTMIIHFIGNGNNGKTTFVNLIQKVLRDMCCTIPGCFFSKDNKVPMSKITDIIEDDDFHLLIASELESNNISVGKIKELIGKDHIHYDKHPHSQTRTKTPSKLLFVSNIDYNFVDPGILQKYKRYPFVSTFHNSPNYENVLINKIDEFFVWLVKGAINYQNRLLLNN